MIETRLLHAIGKIAYIGNENFSVLSSFWGELVYCSIAINQGTEDLSNQVDGYPTREQQELEKELEWLS